MLTIESVKDGAVVRYIVRFGMAEMSDICKLRKQAYSIYANHRVHKVNPNVKPIYVDDKLLEQICKVLTGFSSNIEFEPSAFNNIDTEVALKNEGRFTCGM